MEREVFKLGAIRAVDLPGEVFDDVAPGVLAAWRARVAAEAPSHLRAHPEEIKVTLLAAYLYCRQREIIDALQNVAFAKGARFDGATFSGSADFDEATHEAGAKAIHLEGAHIQDLNAVSPEVTKKPSTWPPGWVVKQEPDGTGTLTWKQSTTKQTTRRKPA